MIQIKLDNSENLVSISEEDIAYTNEELTKIEELRKKSRTNGTLVIKEPKIKNKNTKKEYDGIYRHNLKIGMPVRATVENHTFIGYICRINKENRHYIKYDVETPSGILKDVYYITYRKVTDYSNVVVPEELKVMTTQRLLNELKKSRLVESDENYVTCSTSEYDKVYNSYLIKAELSTRPHIKTKSETKALSNHRKTKRQEKKYDKIKKAKN